MYGPDDPLDIDVLADFNAGDNERPGFDIGIDAALDIHEVLAGAAHPGLDHVLPDLNEENARVGGAGGAAEGRELLFVFGVPMIDVVPHQNHAGGAVFARVGGLAVGLGMVGVDLALEHALLVELLRLVLRTTTNLPCASIPA